MLKVERLEQGQATSGADKEFALKVQNDAMSINVVELTDADARQALAALSSLLRTTGAGQSISEILWAELDSIVDQLHSDGEPEEPEFHNLATQQDLYAELKDWKAWGEQRGKAQGVAYALAIILNPTAPDIEAVRAESVRRRKERE
jgi:hypothetical protein